MTKDASGVDIIKVRESVDLVSEKPGSAEHNARLCLDVLVYFDGPPKSNAAGILAFYEESLRYVRDRVKYVLIDGKGRYRAVTPKTFELLPFWLSSKCAKRDVYALDLVSGTSGEDASDFEFHFYSSTLSPAYLRLILPIELVEKGVGEFKKSALTAVSDLEFLSGYAGYSLNIQHDYPSWMEGDHIYTVSRKYLGIDIGKPLYFAGFMEHGVKPPNWLTMIGSDFLKKLGGKKKLRSRLPEEVGIDDVEHGVVLQAGPAPRLGVVNRKERLPEYRAVWQSIREAAIPDEVVGPYDGIGGTENTQQWLHRFDEVVSK